MVKELRADDAFDKMKIINNKFDELRFDITMLNATK